MRIKKQKKKKTNKKTNNHRPLKKWTRKGIFGYHRITLMNFLQGILGIHDSFCCQFLPKMFQLMIESFLIIFFQKTYKTISNQGKRRKIEIPFR